MPPVPAGARRGATVSGFQRLNQGVPLNRSFYFFQCLNVPVP